MAVFTNITPTEKLRSDAAASFKRAQRAGMPTEVNDGYRSDAEQARLFNANYTPVYALSAKFDRRVWNGKPYWRRTGNTVSVAVPGSKWANHRTGTAVDLGVAARAWMFKNGAAYGWTNPAWAKLKNTYEPWHWEYSSKNDKMKELWKDMPSLKKMSRTKDQSVAAEKWTTVLLNNKGWTSAVIGSKAFDVDATVKLTGLARGAQVQGRFYKVNYKTGKRVYTYNDSFAESTGTDGSTFFTFSVKGGCSADERVRCEIIVWDAGVKIIDAATRAHTW